MLYSCIEWLFFFFSSRRRHTRYWRDWSSDVCSSDLHVHQQALGQAVLAHDGGGQLTALVRELQVTVALDAEQTVALHAGHRLAHRGTALVQALGDPGAQRDDPLLLEFEDRPEVHLGRVDEVVHSTPPCRRRFYGQAPGATGGRVPAERCRGCSGDARPAGTSSVRAVSDSVAVVWDDALLGYTMGGDHPLHPVRLDLTMRLADSLGVLARDRLEVLRPVPAGLDLLTLVHDPAYLAAVKQAPARPDVGFEI